MHNNHKQSLPIVTSPDDIHDEQKIIKLGNEEVSPQAVKFLKKSIAENTYKSYESDLKVFKEWCEKQNVPYLPASPITIANFLADQATVVKSSTLERRIWAIQFVHKKNNIEPLPTKAELVKSVLSGILKENLQATARKKPILPEDLKKIVDTISTETLIGLRDRALLLLGFGGAFRRSELVSIKVEHLNFLDNGISLYLPKSKTDQSGKGATKSILKTNTAYCPVLAIESWLKESRIKSGFIFRSTLPGDQLRPSYNNPKKPDLTPHSVALIVKKYAELAGFNPQDYSGHSLRRGFVTSAYLNGASLFKIKEMTLHENLDNLTIYYEDLEKFERNAAAGLL